MPIRDVLLHHLRKMLFRVRIHRCMSVAGPTVCELLRSGNPSAFLDMNDPCFKLLESTVDNVHLHTYSCCCDVMLC